MDTITNEKAEPKTLAECMNKLKKQGYSKDFQVTSGGLKALDEERHYMPNEVRIVDFYRFEGESDPGDMSILYAIETSDGTKGTLSDAFGPYASRKVSEFFEHVENIEKKTGKKPWWKLWN